MKPESQTQFALEFYDNDDLESWRIKEPTIENKRFYGPKIAMTISTPFNVLTFFSVLLFNSTVKELEP